MMHLVSPDPATAVTTLQRNLTGTAEGPNDFDPLMTATMMIYGRAMQAFGPWIASGEDDKCPVCEILKAQAAHIAAGGHSALTPQQLEQHWTIGAMDEVLLQARELGVMPRLQ